MIRFKLQLNKVSKETILVGLLLFLTFFQGLLSAPSTTDAMVYRLTKPMYWLQNQSYWQTQIETDHDFMAPMAEFIHLHLISLVGSDRLAFLVQWSAYLFILIACWQVMSELKINLRDKLTTLVLVSSIPMVVLQSSSTQNDLITTWFLISSVLFSLKVVQKPSWQHFLYLGISVGLGIFTKATFVSYMIIPGIILTMGLFNQQLSYNDSNLLIKLISAVSISLLLIAPLLINNLYLYQSLLGEHRRDQEVIQYLNEQPGVSATISNVLRNLLMHFPAGPLAEPLTKILARIHLIIGKEISDPTTTFDRTQFSLPQVIIPQEDIVLAPWYVLMFIIAGIFLIKKSASIQPMVKQLYWSGWLSLILFSVLLKWQPYHSRLQIPLFIILTLTSVIILAKSIKNFQLLKYFSWFSWVMALILILFNVAHPWISYQPLKNYVSRFIPQNGQVPQTFLAQDRQTQYFRVRPYWQQPYQQIIAYMRENNLAGELKINLMDNFEYPFWVLVEKQNIPIIISHQYPESDQLLEFVTATTPINYPDKQVYCVATEVNYGYACLVYPKL